MEHHHLPEKPNEQVILELITYNREKYDMFTSSDVDVLLKNLSEERINWINLDGLNVSPIIEKIQAHFCLHSLMVEDILNDQRPKTEEFEDYLFVTLKMLYRIEGAEIDYEQISFVLGSNFLLSFQEKEGDLFNAFRERIRLDQGRVRKKKADYLLYRLIDIIVDNYYNVLDNIGEQIEETEECIRTDTSMETFKKIQQMKKELIYLHKALYPLRDAIGKLVKDESSFIQEENVRYFSDVYDHTIHLIDSLETYRDLTSSLMDIYINTQNTRLNEVIRLLTIISTIFIPLTFIVGVYGMNFKHNFPEIESEYGYPIVWMVMIAIAGSMIAFFRHKKWI
ncbi:magnesium/cobalt transporter CorA [Fulvivirgaceae bacterium PWU4]|uniref:Magnesium transport protein CorA n=1 Tax=Chryseosolibacter histidini TaxID=2782349 RepID=A0AAP2GR95_9BACT|nr:magnesium/cobalt transporter CorA [Chryseosolibacter histidini]MBT1699775.1 magnesium/cobalt transporter CorA [Chryseosolibacter histidini]